MFPKERRIRLPRRLRSWVKQRDCHLIHLYQMKHCPQKRRMHLESRLVQPVGHHGEDFLDQRQQILLVKWLSHVRRSSNILQKFVQNIQTRVRDISFSVLHRPDNCIDHELLVLRRNAEQRRETKMIDSLDKNQRRH